MLAGEGADEILAGLRQQRPRVYRLAAFASGIPAPARRLLGSMGLPGRAGTIAARARAR